MTSSPAPSAPRSLLPGQLLLIACDAAVAITAGLDALAADPALPPDQQDLALKIEAAASDLVRLAEQLSRSASCR